MLNTSVEVGIMNIRFLTFPVKKKLEDSLATRESDKKAWETEKSKLQEEKEKLKSKLLSLSAEKLKTHNEVVQLKKDLGK